MEKPHKRLNVWKESMDLAVDIYTITESFPREERYGVVDQLRRAAVSVPCNIAEGAARQTKREFANFLHMAQGSLSELDTLLEMSGRLGYVNQDLLLQFDGKMVRIDKMLTGLIRKQRS